MGTSKSSLTRPWLGFGGALATSWHLGGRVPGQVWKAAAGRPADTFNYGYGMLAALPSRPGAQAFGVLYRERRHDFFS